jgi:GNAT superfamily N-acetyltransferase
MKAELRAPTTASDWAIYHAIRRRVLFELRGRGSSYDADHPDEHRPNHYPFLLVDRTIAVGVIRIDIHGEVALFRRVAMRDDMQRRGYGRLLLELATEFAARQACVRIDSHVDAEAVGFYGRCGFAPVDVAVEPSAVILMTKSLQ